MNNAVLEQISHFLPMIAVASAVYFLLIRPQQKKAQDHTSLIAHLKPKDYVMTTGGLWGHVQKVTDTKVFLQIHADVVVEVEKTSILSVQPPHEDHGGHAHHEHHHHDEENPVVKEKKSQETPSKKPAGKKAK